MRFHEFYRLESGRIVEIQALWDIPEVMMQAGAWPHGSLFGAGVLHSGAGDDLDGIIPGPWDEAVRRRARTCRRHARTI
jgi:hypothetical protein